MEKWRQQFSVGYFVVALIVIFALQAYFASAPVETITYSQFKALAKKAQVANLVVGEKTIHGEIKPEAVKEALPPGRLKALGDAVKEGKKPLPLSPFEWKTPN